MKILLSGLSMSYLSGQPLYLFELARELKRIGHDVTVISEWDVMLTESGSNLRKNLIADGITCLDKFAKFPEQDLIIAMEKSSQKILDQALTTPTLVVVHSEYDVEEPLADSPQIIKYICIRQNILEHIVKEHAIPRDKCVVIYNGVDRERFKKRKKSRRKYYKIVVPCTLDTMREAFLNKIINQATKDKRVFIFGMDCGAKLDSNEYVTIAPDKFNIEEDIADADEVAGILLGRVNLEAWSCGVPSRIYDPITLESRFYEPPIDFDQNHNIRNVASKMLKIAGNLDDVTVVIPHHSARPHLAKCLESIRNMRYVNIIKGGSFARNCNVGAKLAETEYLLFTNDDTTFNPTILLRQMIATQADIVGATPNKGVQGFDIVKGLLELNPQGHYPSGALLLIKREVFEALKGFDEIFINGAEDIDLFLRAEKAGFTIKRIDAVYQHEESQSIGRFDKLDQNNLLFNRRWHNVCHIGL